MYQSLLMDLLVPNSVSLQITFLSPHCHKFAVKVCEALLFSSQVVGLFKEIVPELGAVRSSNHLRGVTSTMVSFMD